MKFESNTDYKIESYHEALVRLLENSPLNLTEVARECNKLGVKLTVSYLSKLKSGKMPPPSFLITTVLAKVLGENPEYLLSLSLYQNRTENMNEIYEALRFINPDADHADLMEKAFTIAYGPEDHARHLSGYEEPDYYNELSEDEQREYLETIHGANVSEIDNYKTLNIPVLGTIAAGVPLLAQEHIIDYMEIPNMWKLKEGEVFALEVKGDSMIGSRIQEGDRVIVKVQPDVESGEIAVVNVNGNDATLKRVKKIDGKVILFPDNPKYEPLIIENQNARILGKVIQVIFQP